VRFTAADINHLAALHGAASNLLDPSEGAEPTVTLADSRVKFVAQWDADGNVVVDAFPRYASPNPSYRPLTNH
jgi:hypothetical protein